MVDNGNIQNYHMGSIFMSRKKYSKEFKLQLINEHMENGISYWKLGKDNGIVQALFVDGAMFMIHSVKKV